MENWSLVLNTGSTFAVLNCVILQKRLYKYSEAITFTYLVPPFQRTSLPFPPHFPLPFDIDSLNNKIQRDFTPVSPLASDPTTVHLPASTRPFLNAFLK